MTSFHLIVSGCLALATLAACTKTDPAADVATGPTAPTPTAPVGPQNGAVRFDDAWLKVGPFIAHQAQMDLATACLNQREDALAKGATDVVLCYDRLKRDRGVIRTIRVETGFTAMRDAIKRLRDRNESAHFVIERSGSLYQILDIVYPARRDEAYRADEIRVLATGADAQKHVAALLEGLRQHFPGLTTTSVEFKP
jgi:hypothetical protein